MLGEPVQPEVHIDALPRDLRRALVLPVLQETREEHGDVFDLKVGGQLMELLEVQIREG